MKIGIDISQIAYQKTGVANYLQQLVKHLLTIDKHNEYVLFFSSLRGKIPDKNMFQGENVQLKTFKMPPSLLDVLWNKWHIMPIEHFIGDVDIFISSDWVQPPTKKAKKATIVYDFIIYKYPEETHNKTEFSFKNFLLSPNIVASQKRRLQWVKKECDMIFCISDSTKKDAIEILRIDEKRLHVIYAGV